MKTALCISTYNRPDALEICINSTFIQTVLPDEIIIADDGSGEETRQVIEKLTLISPIPIIHIWHEDVGFRLAAIRNKAVASSKSEYIIQIDGDLILNKHFVADHIRFAKSGHFVCGTRSNIDKGLTQKIIENGNFNSISFFSKGLKKKYNAIRNYSISILNSKFQSSQKNIKYVLGCNMAFWKKDFISVNGYNEYFKGWGKEDNDLCNRLFNNKTKLSFLKYGAVIYHLFHEENQRSSINTNAEMLQESINNKTTSVKIGVNKYL